jgi:hypothetical protein
MKATASMTAIADRRRRVLRIIQFFVYSMPTNIYASVGPDIG